MSTENPQTDALDEVPLAIAEIRLLPAIVGGLLGTIAMGAFQHAVGMTGAIAMAMPAMYGVEGPALAVGWGIHLVHGVMLGGTYAILTSIGPIKRHVGDVTTSLGLGVGYGIGTTVVLAGVVMPVWLSAVGFPQAPPLPNIGLNSLIAHVIYGVVLALVYAVWQR